MSLGERQAGGARNPNMLADMFEALLGALYLDQGFAPVVEVVRQCIFTSEKVRQDTKDPKSKLQEIIQQFLKSTPTYTVVSEMGPDHGKTFTISASIAGVTIGTGVGSNKKLAQESAASDALTHQDQWHTLLKEQNSI
jgi:ribonuclease-3